jgi:hypothetical protein
MMTSDIGDIRHTLELASEEEYRRIHHYKNPKLFIPKEMHTS